MCGEPDSVSCGGFGRCCSNAKAPLQREGGKDKHPTNGRLLHLGARVDQEKVKGAGENAQVGWVFISSDVAFPFFPHEGASMKARFFLLTVLCFLVIGVGVRADETKGQGPA
jgi:hypothetical protein